MNLLKREKVKVLRRVLDFCLHQALPNPDLPPPREASLHDFL